MKKVFGFILSVILLATLLTGCGGELAKGESNNFYESDSISPEIPETGSQILPSDRKLIRTAYLEGETENLDELLALLNGEVAALGGYVESLQIQNYSSYSRAVLTVRVPAEKMDELVGNVTQQSNVTYYNEDVEDITLAYVDTQSRLLALETEQTRLLALLERAESLSDILDIETRLTDVRTELETVHSQLRLFDNQVDYATVSLSLKQVSTFTVTEKQTVWQRIATGLSENMSAVIEGVTDIFVLLVVSLPLLIPVVVIGLIVLLIVVLSKRKRKKQIRKQNPQQGQ